MMSQNKNNEIEYITLQLTEKCNLRCYMCGQQKNKFQELDLTTIKALIEKLPKLKFIYLFGGEPLMYSAFEELIEYLNNKEIKILITTNGMLLNKFINTIINSKFTDITISIDSHFDEVNSKIRRGSSLELIIKNVNMLFDAKFQFKMKLPNIGLNCVILKDNYEHLYSYYKFFSNLFPNIDRINFEFQRLVPIELGEKHQDFMKKQLTCNNAESWKNYKYIIDSLYNQDELAELVNQINKLKTKEKISFLGPTHETDIKQYISGGELSNKKSCKFPFKSLAILANGDAVPCVDFPDFVFGNVYVDSIEEICTGIKSTQFKNILLQNNFFPICSRCPRYFDEGDFLMDGHCE